MSRQVNRRQLLKLAAASAAALATAGPGQVAAEVAGAGMVCTLLDLAKCVGCEECVNACQEQWQKTVPDPVEPIPKPFPDRVPIEDFSKRKDITDRLTPYNFLYVEHLEFKYKGNDTELHIPRRCMHCLNPPCADLCPFGACRQEANGVVHIASDICMGGAKCRKVCPWHIPQRQSGVGLYLKIMPRYAGNGAMFKCHRCLPLLEQGKKPRCVEVCPEGVQQIGPRREMVAKAVALAKARAKADCGDEGRWREYIYGLTENGGTNTLYVSPIPFKVVNKVLMAEHKKLIKQENAEALAAGRRPERGPHGRPHMGPVGDVMDHVKWVSWLVVAAPVAGLIAGLSARNKTGGSNNER